MNPDLYRIIVTLAKFHSGDVHYLDWPVAFSVWVAWFNPNWDLRRFENGWRLTKIEKDTMMNLVAFIPAESQLGIAADLLFAKGELQ